MVTASLSRAAGLGLLASLAGVVAPASAAPNGTLAVAARADQYLSGLELATNSSGFAAAVWLTPAASHVVSLRLATRAPGGRWTRPVTVDSAKSSARSLSIGKVVVDNYATVHLLWAEQPRRSATVRLLAAVRHRAGPLLARTTLGTSTAGTALSETLNADLATAPDGTATAVWCQGGNSDNVLDTKNPGTVFARTARGSGRWSAPHKLWKGRACATARVQIDRGGDTLASWSTEVPELDEATTLTALRRAGKRWPIEPMLLSELSDGGANSSTGPVLGTGGVMHLFTYNPTSELGAPGLRYAIQSARTTSPTETVPAPTDALTDGGWIGGGGLTSVSAQVDGGGNPVVLFGTTGVALPSGGLGTSALWAASRSKTGWTLVPIDPLAPLSDPAPASESPQPDVRVDGSGRVVATWVEVGAQTPCRIEIFQSVRAMDGTWSPRVLIGQKGGSGSGAECDPGRLVRAVPAPASLVWTATSRQFVVAPAVGGTGAAPVAANVQLITRTWAEVQRAGAIELQCAAAAAGYCHASLIAAEHDDDLLDALEGFCRPTLATATVGGPAKPGVMRFPLSAGCYEGGPAPAPRTTPVSFPVVTAVDVLGHRSAAHTTTLTIGAG